MRRRSRQVWQSFFHQLWFYPRPSKYHLIRYLLRPLAAVYGLLMRWRQSSAPPSQALAKPSIVVGNVVVGGTGKTPLTIALAQTFTALGKRVVIISRGYGRRVLSSAPIRVSAQHDAAEVGDEALLMCHLTDAAVWVGTNRLRTAKTAYYVEPACDIFLFDDGLQSHQIAFDYRLCVFDQRRLGNGLLLPAGPLRQRLADVQVNAVVGHHTDTRAWWPHTSAPLKHYTMHSSFATPYAVNQPNITITLAELGQRKVHAVCGLGHPQRFFAMLEAAHIDYHGHCFADHHRYQPHDLHFDDDLAIVTTAKDAVKWRDFTFLVDVWVIPLDTVVDPLLINHLCELFDG